MPPSSVPYQCLSCRLSRLVISPARRQLHASAPRRNRKPAYPSVKASDLGLSHAAANPSPVLTRPYTEQEKQLLSRKYTPEQMAVIELGEEAVSTEDLERQGVRRIDPTRISYYDDFSTHRPVIDAVPEGATTKPAKDADAPRDRPNAHREQNDPDAAKEISALERLSNQTGYSLAYIRNLRVKSLVVHRVMNQTHMGKVQSMYVLTIAGNENGMLGVGEGKAAELADASRQAEFAAIRNMKPVFRYENRTIFGDVQGKVCASVVQLQARPPGFGNRCQSLIFEMARAAGIQDLAARTPRSRNKMNVVKAAYKALLSQRHPEDVARARGRKMVDVRKVYYGGSCP